METPKFGIIKTKKVYYQYCDILEDLLSQDKPEQAEDIELLILLIKDWDEKNNSSKELNPIQLLKGLMTENKLKAKDLVAILEVSPGTVSKILNYQSGLSKDIIRKLSTYFKISQEAFNRPYELKNKVNQNFLNAKLMNTKKDLNKDSNKEGRVFSA